jgi:hypothetical protein
MTAEPAGARRKVRIWFGDLLVAEYVADRDRAFRYQRVMTPMFAGLRITIEPIRTGPDAVGAERPAAELPSEQLWPLTVQ